MGLLEMLTGPLAPEQSQGLLGLAAGLMSGNPGQGVAAYAQATGPDAALKRKYTAMQLDNLQSEIDARNQTAARQKMVQEYVAKLLGGQDPQASQAVSPGAYAPAADGMGPTMPSPQAAQSGSRLGNMSIDQIAGLHALGGPNLMDAYKFIKEPLKLEQGSTYVDRGTGQERFMPKVDPGIAPGANGVYGALPGYAQAQANIAGAQAQAQERARAGLDPFTIPARNDGTPPTLTTRAALVDGLTRAPVQGPANAPEAALREKVSGDMGADPNAIRAEIRKTVDDLTRRQMDPASRKLLEDHIVEMGRQLKAIQAQPVPQQAQPAAQVAQGQDGIALQTEAQKLSANKYAEKTAEDAADTRKNIMSAGMAAPQAIAKYQQLGKLLADVDGGTLTATGTNIASAMNSLGLKIDKNLPNKEAAAALGNEMALQLRSPAGGAGMPGAMSDKDREFLVGMIPNASQTAKGRQQLIDAQIAIEGRKQQIATFARNYEKKHGRLDNGFFEQLQSWSNANPLFGGK